ncbi:hypothetical protein GQ42DRAFT_165304 [Ramicandelaber brevisporus]|nr:hypothetical protein GQ42DRAFT_165304 [Ramicandelaber brevisporus]
MREPNFYYPTHNKASVSINSSLYDRRALDCTAVLPLLNSLSHLGVLIISAPRIRDVLMTDGGVERLVDILRKTPGNQDVLNHWTWTAAYQCIVQLGIRGTESIRKRLVKIGIVELLVAMLKSHLAVHQLKIVDESVRDYNEKEQHRQQVLQYLASMRAMQKQQQQRQMFKSMLLTAATGEEHEATAAMSSASLVTPDGHNRHALDVMLNRNPTMSILRVDGSAATLPLTPGATPHNTSATGSMSDLLVNSSGSSSSNNSDHSAANDSVLRATAVTAAATAHALKYELQQRMAGAAISSASDSASTSSSTSNSATTTAAAVSASGFMAACPTSTTTPILPPAPTFDHSYPLHMDGYYPADPYAHSSMLLNLPQPPPPPTLDEVKTLHLNISAAFADTLMNYDHNVLSRTDDILYALHLLSYLTKYLDTREEINRASCGVGIDNIFAAAECFTDPRVFDPSVVSYANAAVKNMLRHDDDSVPRRCINFYCLKQLDSKHQHQHQVYRCKHCKRARYCSKKCLGESWQHGHRHWCSGNKQQQAAVNTAPATISAVLAAPSAMPSREIPAQAFPTAATDLAAAAAAAAAAAQTTVVPTIALPGSIAESAGILLTQTTPTPSQPGTVQDPLALDHTLMPTRRTVYTAVAP